MSENKTKPTNNPVEAFIKTVAARRQKEAHTLIATMREITKKDPVMWGPSMIGFGAHHYTYDSGREGDVPLLCFSPRRASITIYFNEGFDRYAQELERLGAFTHSLSCLYINKLEDVDLKVLRQMLEKSYALHTQRRPKPTTVEEYITSTPIQARDTFLELRQLVKDTLPQSEEVLSYDILGYKAQSKRVQVYISAWKDRVALYPLPKDEHVKKS